MNQTKKTRIFENVAYLLALEAATVVRAKKMLKEPQIEATALYWLSTISRLTIGEIVTWRFYKDVYEQESIAAEKCPGIDW